MILGFDNEPPFNFQPFTSELPQATDPFVAVKVIVVPLHCCVEGPVMDTTGLLLTVRLMLKLETQVLSFV